MVRFLVISSTIRREKNVKPYAKYQVFRSFGSKWIRKSCSEYIVATHHRPVYVIAVLYFAVLCYSFVCTVPYNSVRLSVSVQQLGSPPPLSSHHCNLEPLGRWHGTIFQDFFQLIIYTKHTFSTSHMAFPTLGLFPYTWLIG